jgi:hypothetical protein
MRMQVFGGLGMERSLKMSGEEICGGLVSVYYNTDRCVKIIPDKECY